MEEAGFYCPWESKVVSARAAGDDGNITAPNSECGKILVAIRDNTSPHKEGCYGLGQCIKDVKVGAFDDIDFCSKWSFSHGSVESLVMTRDYGKLFT